MTQKKYVFFINQNKQKVYAKSLRRAYIDTIKKKYGRETIKDKYFFDWVYLDYAKNGFEMMTKNRIRKLFDKLNEYKSCCICNSWYKCILMKECIIDKHSVKQYSVYRCKKCIRKR